MRDAALNEHGDRLVALVADHPAYEGTGVLGGRRNKTVTVLVERRVTHELYGKIVGRSRKYQAHDEKGEYHTGDKVEIAEGRPISKTKSWVVTRLLQKAGLV